MAEITETITIPPQSGDNGLRQRLHVQLLPVDSQDADAIRIEVDEPSNASEVDAAIAQRAAREHWFLSPDFQTERLLEKYEIDLGGDTVELYNFQAKPLSERHVGLIAHSLAVFHQRLKSPAHWKLKSIQIRSKDIENGKSGHPFRGLEFPEQQRFELFPASFDEGNYRDTVNCTWLEGSTLHEAEHVNLEAVLNPLWQQHIEELGWTHTDDTLIELPGGIRTTNYNQYPSRCPTVYATYQEDDDRAESVVQFLVDEEKLEGQRREIVSEVFDPKPSNLREPVILAMEPTMPEANLRVKVTKRDTEGFVFRSTGRRQGISKPVVSLANFQQQHGITV